MSDKIKFILTTSLSIIALVIASASFYVAYRTQQFSRTDDVSVNITAHTEGSSILLNTDSSGDISYVRVPFDVTISNIGNRKLSIIRYRVYQLQKSGTESWYDNIDGGLTDSNRRSINLPLILDVGESSKMVLYIGIIANREALYELQKQYPSGASLSRGELSKLLAIKRKDIYGNKVDYNDSTGDIKITPENQRDQKFNVEFLTGTGRVFTAPASWYGNPSN